MGVYKRRDKPLLLTNQIIQRQGGHAPQTGVLLSPCRYSGRFRRDPVKLKKSEWEDFSSSIPLHLLSVAPLLLPHSAAPRPAGGAHWELQRGKEAWPHCLTNLRHQGAWLQPIIRLDRRLSGANQVMKEVLPSFFSSNCFRHDFRNKKRWMGRAKVSYEGSLLLRTERRMGEQSVDRPEDEDGSEDRRKDKRPVASTPVPGSPWCVVWTGDDRVFFFNPTIHLSVWERPGDLIGRDISHIIEDPPHKRKRMMTADSSCQSSGHHGNHQDEHEHNFKRNRTEEPMSRLLPLERRVARFREMMLERGVSAFSSWEKELHKMVFDPRYLLLTSDQRRQVFDEFVKSRLRDEYKEKKNKLQKSRDEFKQLLEEANVTCRSTFKEFCACYRGDQRFTALNRKKEQEVLFQHYITSLKKRDKENRARLRKMR